MGIKELWTLLAPFCDRKPLYELQGKTVAVDLSCWICEAQNIADYQVQPRMYLRNLYFRTCYLLLMGVSPVFVLEGKAPELKYDTISARNAVQFKGAKPKTAGVKTGKDRTRFHFVLKQCEEMLGYMGLACVKGKGEAESLCAYLNEDGLVDGCISQDSDCFAYGALVVYRNFSISTQGNQAAAGGSVDVYDIRTANEKLKFGRNKIIAMALLIGSDYSDGVHGVGKSAVLKFFETVPDDAVLDRIRSWKTNKKLFDEYEQQLSDKNICSSCGHYGKLQSHTKNGCTSCKTTKGCDPFKYKEQRQNIKNEVSIRAKAIQDPSFPNESLIQEFLVKKDNVTQLDIKWRQPNLVQFIKFACKFLQWEELYAFEKILPVVTRWQCRNSELLNGQKGLLTPLKIKKVRNPKGVPSYEIIWTDPEGVYKDLIPDSQLVDNNVDLEKLWSTIEPQDLVEETYPTLVEEFKLSKIKPKKRKKNTDPDLAALEDTSTSSKPSKKRTRKPRATKQIDELNSSFGGLNLKEKPSKKKPKSVKNTLDNFVKQVLLNCPKSTPVKGNNELSFNLDVSSFGEGADLDLSDVISNIVSRKDVPNELKRVADEYVSKKPIVKDDVFCLDDSDVHIDGKPEQMSFFMESFAGDDMFEVEFNRTFKNFDSDGSDTEEYDLNKDECIVLDSDSLCF